MKHPSAQDLQPLNETAQRLIETLDQSMIETSSLHTTLKILCSQLSDCDIPLLKQ